MSLEERILNIAEAPAWFDSRELRAIALEVRKREDRIKQLENRIQQLEEAGDALYELCDPSPIQFDLVDQIPQRLKAWEEAKEAKP